MTFTVTAGPLAYAQAQDISGRLEASLPSLAAVALHEIDDARGLWDLIAYVDDEASAAAVRERLEREGLAVDVAPLPPTDWIARSLQGLGPIRAGRFFLHGAHDRALRRAGGVSLQIDAGAAFGTGHHETTQGCLLALDRLLTARRPRRVLDVGAGSGVLAIAAAKAVKAKALAGDLDMEAVRVARHNAAVNDASPLVRVIAAHGVGHPEIRRSAPYDLVFANILARPLIALAPALARILAPRGSLVLSGLTRAQERSVFAAYRSRGLATADRIRLGDWSTLVVSRPP